MLKDKDNAQPESHKSEEQLVEQHSEDGDSLLLMRQNEQGEWDMVHADNKDVIYQSASHIKLILASEIADKAENSDINLDKELTLISDIVADDPHVAPLPESATMTVKEALQAMLTTSSSSAYNMLLKETYLEHFEAGI